MSKLRPTLVGSVSFLALVGNVAFWILPLILVAAVRGLLPFAPVARACRRAANAIATMWIGFNIAGLKLGGRANRQMEWEVTEPGDLDRNSWYLVTSNHRSAVDIAILQWLFHRRIPMLKFFLKHQLFWVPGLGLGWWALEFPFMRRYPREVLEKRPELRQRDLDTTRRACERFRHVPTCVLNFLEGTRFTAAKRDRQASPYNHLLLPRAGGVAYVVSSMGDRLRSWLDVTLIYPDGTPGFWELISGQVPRVRLHVEEIPIDPSWVGRDYLNDADFRNQFQAFVRDLWARKDARIEEMIEAGGAGRAAGAGRSST